MCSDRKMTLAVTGGIGSGKSLVCSMFAASGIPVYDSDLRTRALYDSSPGLLARISSALGTDVSGPDGKADRRKIASAVFPDPSRLALLEAVVHPEVRRDFSLWKAEFDGAGVPFVIIESAIILEKPFFRDVFGPSATLLPRCRWGMTRSIKSKKKTPSKRPAAAGKKGPLRISKCALQRGRK